MLLYGSYGYVGQQVTREAVSRDLPVQLVGRDYDRLADQAEELGRLGPRFALNGPGTVTEAIENVDCVLNCAGSFLNTAELLVEACPETSTDYVDITEEIPVIERIYYRGS